jgi:hypothetical protein
MELKRVCGWKPGQFSPEILHINLWESLRESLRAE